jgi:hypothetical protein
MHTNGKERAEEWAVRSAFRRLNNVTYLQKSNLVKLINEKRGLDLNGFQLQEFLLQTIESQHPKCQRIKNPNQQIHYEILRLAYVEQEDIATIINQLVLSERQYHRHLKDAIQAVTASILGQ